MISRRSLVLTALLSSVVVTTACGSDDPESTTSTEEPAAATSAAADGYPQQPITLVVPYAAGGGTDVVARIFAEALAEHGIETEQVNMPGAGAVTGTKFVLDSDPDGYTVGFSDLGPAVVTPQAQDVGYDPDDLSHLALLTTYGYAFVGPEDGPALDELIAQADAGENITYGTSGPLTGSTVGAQLFADRAGVEMTAVPYDGSGEILLAVQADEVDFGAVSASAAIEAVEGGQAIEVLGTTLGERDAGTEDLPTVTEVTGVELDWPGFRGLFGPPEMPDEVAAFWDQTMTELAGNDDLAATFLEAGEAFTPKGGAETADFISTIAESSIDVVQRVD